jgi:hypothetical protein
MGRSADVLAASLVAAGEFVFQETAEDLFLILAQGLHGNPFQE